MSGEAVFTRKGTLIRFRVVTVGFAAPIGAVEGAAISALTVPSLRLAALLGGWEHQLPHGLAVATGILMGVLPLYVYKNVRQKEGKRKVYSHARMYMAEAHTMMLRDAHEHTNLEPFTGIERKALTRKLTNLALETHAIAAIASATVVGLIVD